MPEFPVLFRCLPKRKSLPFQLSEEELRELEEWREVSPENKLLYDRWQDGAFLEVGFKNYQRIGRRKALLDMEKRVQLQRKKEVRLRVLRWGAVAAVFVVAVFSSLYLFKRETEEPVKEQVAIVLMKPQRPVLRLDDGTTMLLDSLKGDFEEAGILVKKTGESRSEERRVGKECRSRWSPYH